ncbi:MAG: hypothetical protein GY757_60115, partial [bacterium]|nr:hypothetical protein [bacterium]
ELEKKLVEIWTQILTPDPDSQQLGIDDDFFNNGGQSLKAAITVSEIHKVLNVKITPAVIFDKSTVRKLAAYIKETAEETYRSIEPVEEKEYYNLSSAQRRLYVLQQTGKLNPVYNLPYFAILEGQLDIERLQGVFRRLISRHESFRTSFRTVAGEPVQVVRKNEEIEFSPEYCELKTEDWQAETEAFIRPFDLTRAPLLRAGV